jgi:hypothetical protein
MSRPTTRTELLDHVVYAQLVQFCENDRRTMKAFYDKFMQEDISYPTFQAAIRGELASEETCNAIIAALDEAERREARMHLWRCPHCKGSLR